MQQWEWSDRKSVFLDLVHYLQLFFLLFLFQCHGAYNLVQKTPKILKTLYLEMA